MRANSFKPYDSNGKQLDLLSIMDGKDDGELYAFMRKERGENAGQLLPVRICFKRKDKNALDSTRKKMKRKAVFPTKRLLNYTDSGGRLNSTLSVLSRFLAMESYLKNPIKAFSLGLTENL